MAICADRTVIITGAGGGLGRAYALALAAQGANVVVNDIRSEAAQAVAQEIRNNGGQAIANHDDITTLVTAQRIVDAALAAFGEVHVVINNAGVLRDRMFISLSEEDWDRVMQVHLKGHYCLANILGRRWRDLAKAGTPVDARIINTSSGAGLQGSVGQSNYSAAKGGIASLTLVQAAELARYGVTANALAPAARTSMTESAMPDVVKNPKMAVLMPGPQKTLHRWWYGWPARRRPMSAARSLRARAGAYPSLTAGAQASPVTKARCGR